MSPKANRLVVAGVVTGVLVAIVVMTKYKQDEPGIAYSEFLRQVQTGAVSRATVAITRGSGVDRVAYTLKNGSQLKTIVPRNDSAAMAAMREKMVGIEITDGASQTARVLQNAAPFLVLLAVWVILMLRGFPAKWRSAA